MKKLLLLSIFFLSFSSISNLLLSQALEIINPDTLVVGDANDFDNMPHSYATIKNNTFNTIEIKARLTIEQLAPGHMIAFCLGMCYPPTDQDMTSPGSFLIEAGQSTNHNDFYATLEHNGNIGTTIVKFRFFDINNANNYVEYRCIFNVIYTGVEDEFITEVTISPPYPNPVADLINFDFSNYGSITNYILKIFNCEGKLFKSYFIDNNSKKIILNLSDLPSGVYFYYFDFNGKKSKTNRFLIHR